MSSKGNARRITCRIFYDGADVGLPRRAEGIEYTENSEGMSDEVQLTFAGALAKKLMMKTDIEKEHEVEVVLVFKNWWKNGSIHYYKCGKFTVDDISFSGPAHQCTIRAIALPASTDFQTVKKSKTWQKATIAQIVTEKAGEYGLSAVCSSADSVIETIEQSNETDSSFLTKLCQNYGLYMKVLKEGIAVFDKATYEALPPVKTYRESDMESWEWNTTLVGTYTGATISYTNPNKVKRKKGEKTPPSEKSITITVGQGPRILQINETCSDEAEARRKAAAKINSENEKAQTIEFTTISPADFRIHATQTILIANMGRATGKYFVTSVNHTVSSGGHQMRITAYKIFERFS